MSKEITEEEMVKFTEVISKFEDSIFLDTGVNEISGGFARADMYDYDDDYCDILLQWGVQSDCENTEYQEEYKLNRKTLEIEDGGHEVCIHKN